MAEIRKEEVYQSIHADYLNFAVLSFRACKQGETHFAYDTYVDRDAIEAIRYSYDCLEASVEFVFDMVQRGQLCIKPEKNWLWRYINRVWGGLSLADRLGMLAFACTGEGFWRKIEQWRLFFDLKRVRNGLTHSKPFGEQITKEVLEEVEMPNNVSYTRSRRIDTQQIGSSQLVCREEAVAHFAPSPDKLGADDGEQALEILLHHLIRLEEIFFKGQATTWFGFYDESGNTILSTEDLLGTITRRFGKFW